ncbi:homoserine kinase [Lentibacillus amyloliquefaciens]|uniref:Homoserine kinase n=1 Tax=Lentibacillus amyloliquefaciens TaxID=1472767 RepID=A0A0U4F916_9BACI|nr:homoserine kinase [Lentibacillus amyloliquefaciens]ALX49299.1 homoserine kinase [Lentibacillus amyloliquefaciens]
MKSFGIRVPASSANIGPGFDSMGLALNLYLTLKVSPSDKWEITQHSPNLPEQTDYDNHYIIQVARSVAANWNQELPACSITIESEIPLARGLGSSASAIVAGIELADQACNLNLTQEQKLEIGTEIEGHPDNVAPALVGGFIISTVVNDDVDWASLQDPDLEVILYIPGSDLKTEEARSVLPENYTREHAASASAISNVLIASLAAGDYSLAGKMMEQDVFHEPYRASMIPNYHDIRREAKQQGAYGTVISGAGPTMMSFVPKDKGQMIVAHFQEFLPDYQVVLLQADHTGSSIISNF